MITRTGTLFLAKSGGSRHYLIVGTTLTNANDLYILSQPSPPHQNGVEKLSPELPFHPKGAPKWVSGQSGTKRCTAATRPLALSKQQLEGHPGKVRIGKLLQTLQAKQDYAPKTVFVHARCTLDKLQLLDE